VNIIELRKLTVKHHRQALECILRSVEISNAPDYPPSIIEYQLKTHYTKDWINRAMQSRYFLAALVDDEVVGTGSLDGDEIKAVFVDPDHQRRGIGRAIMEELERYGKSKGLQEVRLNATITAFEFYKKLNYSLVEELVGEFKGDKITAYSMNKRL
jgi:ribosomal protein S18 acetylase RimI-like enzyme